MNTPYAAASSSSMNARGEIVKMLQKFGCESVGFMDDFKEQSVLLQFLFHGRQIKLKVGAKGWATLFLKDNPWNHRRRTSRKDYEEIALEQGMIAINCILRDWVKGQLTAIECGLMPFDHVFLPYMITASGETIADRVGDRTLKLLEA